MRSYRFLWAVIYGLVLVSFTVYACLDTFVIQRVYEIPEQPVTRFTESVTSASESAAGTETDVESETAAVTGETSGAPETEPYVTDDSYDDGNIKITLTEYRYGDTTVYVADVLLSDPSYLKTALARSVYGRNVTEKTSVTASQNGAILAVNGDYYGARQKGYVIRNGILYRNTPVSGAEDLVIYRDGTFGIISESDVTAEELLEAGASDVLSFGPALIRDGVIAVSEDDEVGRAMASNPRTAVGVIDDLHYVFVVSDGRTDESAGLDLYELADFMSLLGVTTAYNLDGGGSSTMVFNGSVVNNPTTNGKKITERSVSDIVYVGYR